MIHGAALLSSQLFLKPQLLLKPHSQVVISPEACMTCLLSQHVGAMAVASKDWHCGFLERMHTRACTPQMLSPGVFICVQAACTQAASFCMHARELGGQSYLWGKVKVSGEVPWRLRLSYSCFNVIW